MLAFTRRRGETIVIGEPGRPIATITIVHNRKGRVKVGIDAAKSVPVNRGEVAKAIADERKAVLA